MHDEYGREIPDPTPLEMPAGVGRPESLAETIRRMVRNEQFVAALGGAESFEEANDFDIPGEDDFKSPHEEIEMSDEEVFDAMEFAEERRDRTGGKGKGAAEPPPSPAPGSASSATPGGQDRDSSGSGRAGGSAGPSRKAE